MSPGGPAGLRPLSVVVIGSGVSGLSAAHRIWTESRRRQIELELTVLDASARPGGAIGTVERDGFVMEQGPDCFLSTKPAAVQLCHELGLAADLMGTNPHHRRSYIARDGELHQVPEGFHLLAPSKFWPFVTTGLFSWAGKLRMGMDLLIPARRGGREETLAEFVIRRLGREALDQAAQPMIGGIYTADPRKLSLQATMPQFLEMEQKHGSILLAMWKARQAQGAAPKAGGRASGARYDLFLTLRGGLARLVESLVARLPAGSIRSGSTVESLERTGLRWTVRSGALGALEADAVCVSLPAGASSRLLTKADPPLAQDLAGIPYASVATVNLGFDRSQVRHALDGMGFVVPAVERRAIVAASFSSVKFAGRSPADRALLRAFVGGAMHPEALAMDDDTLVEAVMRDLRQYVGVQGAPRTVLVSRYESAMAQYCVGHLDRVARIEAHEAALPGLALAGNGYRGVGIGDCVASGERAARRLIDYLTDLDAARHNGARELAAAAR